MDYYVSLRCSKCCSRYLPHSPFFYYPSWVVRAGKSGKDVVWSYCKSCSLKEHQKQNNLSHNIMAIKELSLIANTPSKINLRQSGMFTIEL